MSAEKILTDWKRQVFKPVYWLEGEEDFFIDQVMNYAEHHVLNESEAAFNLTIFYGKDADWASVVNACRRYPMFAERQVVLLKEAQQMKEIDKLEAYIENPLKSTIFVVSYKEKKVDGRTRLAKLLKEKGVVLTTKKIYDNQLPDWVDKFVREKGLAIQPKAIFLLVDHIGNDLSRLANEIEKLCINLEERKDITEDDIEKFIGISKEYNVFELQHALAKKDLPKAIRIIQFFEANPKAAPIQFILPSLYAFFSKVYMLFSVQAKDDKEAASAIGVHPFYFRDYKEAAEQFSFPGVEKLLMLLHHYNLRSIGVDDAGTEDASLMKELVFKILQ